MATAADAATAALEAPATPETAAAPEIPANVADNAEAPAASATKPAGTSELVKLAREKRALERKIAEYERAPKAPPGHTVTRESLLAELKAKYDEDPDAFLDEVAGEDFVTLAQRLAKRAEASQAPEKQIEALQKQVKELTDKLDGGEKAKATAEAEAITKQHVEAVQKAIEDAKDEDGAPLYPTLATLDDAALDEPVAVTAYNAVARAWQKECVKDGKVVKKWSEAEQQDRFNKAFAALDAHYGKLRTPKNTQNPSTQEPERESRTISNTTSSGVADPPARRVPGTLSKEEALRQALKEHGYA